MGTRYSDTSLRGIILDIYFLSRSNHLVCTFSSQVRRDYFLFLLEDDSLLGVLCRAGITGLSAAKCFVTHFFFFFCVKATKLCSSAQGVNKPPKRFGWHAADFLHATFWGVPVSLITCGG